MYLNIFFLFSKNATDMTKSVKMSRNEYTDPVHV